MDNKKLGIIMIVGSFLLFGILLVLNFEIDRVYQSQIDYYVTTGEACPSDPAICPHVQKAKAKIPIYLGSAILIGILSLSLYLIFFEKGEKAILKTLEETKKRETTEKHFKILLSALDETEQKVLEAIKEQEGITQSTLRIRTDLSKAKLSLVLTDFEKKGLIKKVKKGKTYKIYLKKTL